MNSNHWYSYHIIPSITKLRLLGNPSDVRILLHCYMFAARTVLAAAPRNLSVLPGKTKNVAPVKYFSAASETMAIKGMVQIWNARVTLRHYPCVINCPAAITACHSDYKLKFKQGCPGSVNDWKGIVHRKKTFKKKTALLLNVPVCGFVWAVYTWHMCKSCQCMVRDHTASRAFILTGRCYTHLWWPDMLISTRSFSNGCHFTNPTSSMLLAGIHVPTIQTWCLALPWRTLKKWKKNKWGLICTNHSMGFCWFFRRGFFFPSFPPPSWLWRSVFPVINFCVLEGRGECVHTEGPTTLLATSYNFA